MINTKKNCMPAGNQARARIYERLVMVTDYKIKNPLYAQLKKEVPVRNG